MQSTSDWDRNSIQHYDTVAHIQKQLRRSNTRYLSNHPEVRAIIRLFLYEAINNNPKNIYQFGAKLFDCNNSHLLVNSVNKHLKQITTLLKKGHWTEYDGNMIFEEKKSTHSLLSKSSVSDSADSLLRYALVLEHPELCTQTTQPTEGDRTSNLR